MEIKTWKPGMSDKETADIAYWERNMLALYLADGWYYDDVEKSVLEYPDGLAVEVDPPQKFPRYTGWRRVLSCLDGQACFHIPDDFNVLNLPQIEPNWDGHSTPEKWERLAEKIQMFWGMKANPEFKEWAKGRTMMSEGEAAKAIMDAWIDKQGGRVSIPDGWKPWEKKE